MTNRRNWCFRFSLALAILLCIKHSLTAEPRWANLPAEIPEVLLSEGHQQFCVIGVGDTFPMGTLQKTDGGSVQLDELLGKKVTIMFFWKAGQRMSLTGLTDLTTDVADKFGDQDVQIIGIAVKEAASSVNQITAETSTNYPMLIDPEGSLFAQIGTKKLPRVFVLDSEHKIVWFDIEYSLATRRELGQVLRALL